MAATVLFYMTFPVPVPRPVTFAKPHDARGYPFPSIPHCFPFRVRCMVVGHQTRLGQNVRGTQVSDDILMKSGDMCFSAVAIKRAFWCGATSFTGYGHKEYPSAPGLTDHKNNHSPNSNKSIVYPTNYSPIQQTQYLILRQHREVSKQVYSSSCASSR